MKLPFAEGKGGKSEGRRSVLGGGNDEMSKECRKAVMR